MISRFSEASLQALFSFVFSISLDVRHPPMGLVHETVDMPDHEIRLLGERTCGELKSMPVTIEA